MPVDPALDAELQRRGIGAQPPPAATSGLDQELQRRGVTPSPLSPEAGLARQREGMTHFQTENLPGGRAVGVDYTTGTNFLDRMALQQASTAEDRKLYLDKTYGPENVFTDQGGRFFIKDKAGKFVDPSGGSLAGRIGSYLAAEAPILGGATMGAAIGGPPGAMVGGAMGQTATEMAKILSGRSASTLGRKAQEIGMTGLEMGAGEKLGQMIIGLPAAAGRFFREKLAGVTPEGRQMAASIERLGGAAPLRSVAPGLASPIQKIDISTRLGMDWLAERNNPVVQRRLRGIVESLHMSPEETNQIVTQILDPTSAISSREAGEIVQKAVTSNVRQMEGAVSALQTKAQQSLDTQLANINQRMAQPGALGADVAEAFKSAHRAFSNQAAEIYGQIDPIVGNTGVIPTGPMMRAAKALLDAMPKTKATAATAESPAQPGRPIFEDPTVLDSVIKLTKLDERIRFRDAQRIRSTLGDWAFSPDILRTIPEREFSLLRDAVDQSFDLAMTDPAVAPAVSLLRRGDAFYREGIRKFENLAINRMAKDVQDGIVPDPKIVAGTVLREGQTQQAEQIKKMLPPSVWNRVAGADWQAMLASAKEPQTGEVMSRRLASEIRDRDLGGLLDVTYGPMARDLRLYSQRLAAFNQKIPANELAQDSFGATMRTLEVRQARLDAYMRDNYLFALSKPGQQADEAIKWIVRPGQEQRLITAQQEFGPASPQMRAIRIQALKELLHQAVEPTTTGVGSKMSGAGIDEALSRYTPQQQQILFPDGLADDMRFLGRQIRAMYPVLYDQMAGGLIAGKIKNTPLLASMAWARSGAITGAAVLGLPGLAGGVTGGAIGAGVGGTLGAVGGALAGGRLARTAYYEGLSWIYSHPNTVRVLTQGLRPGPKQAATRDTIRMIFRASALGTLPRTEEVRDPAQHSVPARQTVTTNSQPTMRRPQTPAPPPMPGP